MKNRGRYADIISLPHPVSARHRPMPAASRAAQFAPFAALTGYEEAVAETARLTEERIIPDSNAIEEINRILVNVSSKASHRPLCRITYFAPDERKSGGAYVTVSERIREIDTYEHKLKTECGRIIPIGDITEIEEL